MSGPAASVIGAAEVPAGPVERQIRLNEIELKSIKSNQIALNSVKLILFNSLQTFAASTTLSFTEDSTDPYSSTSSWVTTTGT